MKILSSKQIDVQKWDNCIRHAPNGSVFALSWYLNSVADQWEGLVIGDYQAVIPLVVKSKYGIKVAYQPFFTRNFDLYSSLEGGSDQSLECMQMIQEHVKYLEFCLPENFPIPPGFTAKERRFQVLDLSAELPQLQAGYSENVKRSIKKAIKAGYSVERNVSAESIVKLFRETKGKDLEVFKDDDYVKLKHLMKNCLDHQAGLTLGIYDADGQLHAGAFFISFQGRFTFLKSGASETGRKNGAMQYLFDQFISAHRGNGKLLDFGGSSVESVARFYASFGGKDCVYLQVKKNGLPRVIRWFKK